MKASIDSRELFVIREIEFGLVLNQRECFINATNECVLLNQVTDTCPKGNTLNKGARIAQLVKA